MERVLKNVEFKAELRDPSLAAGILRTLGAKFIQRMEQTDTYYKVVHGRLKKREARILKPEGIPAEPAEFIFYTREDALKPKVSEFTIYTEDEAAARYGSAPLPIWLVVRKVRTLYMIGPTRVHLDKVEDLGSFVEFESMVSKTNTESQAREHNQTLREALHPVLGEPLAASYSDLLAAELERAQVNQPNAD